MSDRMMAARFQLTKGTLLFVAVYAPTSSADTDVLDEFYEQLQDWIDYNRKTRDILTVAGDFNAKLGNQHTPPVMGPHGIGERNASGDRLFDFCMANNITAAHSWFRKRASQKVTWISRAGNAKNAIDHILIDQQSRNHMTDCRSFSACFDTDHRLVLCNIKLKFKRPFNRSINSRKPNIDSLKNEQTADRLRCILKEKLKHGEQLDHIAAVIHEETIMTCGFKATQVNQPYLSQASIDLIHTKKGAKNSDPARYKQPVKEVKRSTQKDLDGWLAEQIATMNEAQRTHNVRALFKTADTLLQKPKLPEVNIKDENGKLLQTVEEQISRWEEYSKKLFVSDRPCPQIQPNNGEYTLPTIEETAKAIADLNNNKATGCDNVTSPHKSHRSWISCMKQYAPYGRKENGPRP